MMLDSKGGNMLASINIGRHIRMKRWSTAVSAKTTYCGGDPNAPDAPNRSHRAGPAIGTRHAATALAAVWQLRCVWAIEVLFANPANILASAASWHDQLRLQENEPPMRGNRGVASEPGAPVGGYRSHKKIYEGITG
jgi:hypothetical protein